VVDGATTRPPCSKANAPTRLDELLTTHVTCVASKPYTLRDHLLRNILWLTLLTHNIERRRIARDRVAGIGIFAVTDTDVVAERNWMGRGGTAA